jgi:hypothetical protein
LHHTPPRCWRLLEPARHLGPCEAWRHRIVSAVARRRDEHPKRTSTRWANIGYDPALPLEEHKDAGGRTALGSDWPVASLNPGRGMFVALNRLPHPPIPDQKLTMRDLIDEYARDGAYTIFEDERRGTLTAGEACRYRHPRQRRDRAAPGRVGRFGH